MSMRVCGQVWGIGGISATEKIVLLKFADHANDEGSNAYPSVARVAAECSLSERAVQAIIRRLEALGHLVVERPHDRAKHRPTTYQVVTAPAPGEAHAPGETVPGADGAAPGERDAPGPGERAAPDPIRISENHQITQKTRARARRITEADEDFKAEMVLLYARVATPERVRLEIEDALGHTAALKRHDMKAYVRNWLSKTRWGDGKSTGGGAGAQVRGGYGQDRGSGGVARVGRARSEPIPIDLPPRPTNGAVQPRVAAKVPGAQPGRGDAGRVVAS